MTPNILNDKKIFKTGSCIIAGSRTIYDDVWIEKAIQLSNFKITEVVSGCAAGPDSMGEDWAIKNKIPIKKFPANWNLGKHAGFLRNKEMSI